MNQNLLRLIYSHKKCNLTDQQILTVLLGMGIVETVAIEHLNYYNQMEKDYAKKKTEVTPEVPELAVDRNMEVSEPVKNSTDKKRTDTVKNIKENNMKNFTALKLYENIIQANEMFVGANLNINERIVNFQTRLRLQHEAISLSYRMEHIIRVLNDDRPFADSTLTYWVMLLVETRNLLVKWKDSDKSRLSELL